MLFRSLTGMLVYSTTMALPFFVLGVSPALLKSVPRSGGWLETAKITLAFFELMLVVYYLSKSDWGWGLGVLIRESTLGIWLALGACTAAYLLGWLKLRGHEDGGAIGPGRLAAGGLALIFCGTLVAGLAGTDFGAAEALLQKGLAERATEAAEARARKAGEAPSKTAKSFDEGLRLAKASALPLFVEFTAFT